ncbi:homing endonuclease [Tuber indicum]|nr:homing endonuclease [Tuber indicum]
MVLPGSKTNSFYITGLVDGEGSFGIYLTKYNKSKAGYSIQPNFQITLHKNDYALLETIKLYFYVGSIYKDGESLYKYSVRSLKDLEIILKHFDKYPLHTQKRADYELFKQVVLMLLNKRHFTEEGLLKIIAIKAAMNKGLSESLKTAFPDFIPVPRPSCFLVNIFKSPKNKFGKRVTLRFTITQHARDVELLKNIITFLDCGTIQSNLDSTKKVAVSKFSDITEKIIPFFDKYPLKGTKAKDYSDFKKVVNLIENKVHLTQSGLDEIARIKARMNSARR